MVIGQRCVPVVDTVQSFVRKSPKALRYERRRMEGHRARSFDNISLLSGVQDKGPGYPWQHRVS